jgi:hypothetical protein
MDSFLFSSCSSDTAFLLKAATDHFLVDVLVVFCNFFC